DRIWHVPTAADIDKPRLLQAGIQLVAGQEVPVFYRAVHPGQAVLTPRDSAKLIPFRRIIKEKAEIHQQAPGLQYPKEALVQRKLLVQRDFMIPAFEHDAIKHPVG